MATRSFRESRRVAARVAAALALAGIAALGLGAGSAAADTAAHRDAAPGVQGDTQLRPTGGLWGGV